MVASSLRIIVSFFVFGSPLGKEGGNTGLDASPENQKNQKNHQKKDFRTFPKPCLQSKGLRIIGFFLVFWFFWVFGSSVGK